MRLYDTQRSGNAWKVRLLAGFLGLPLERRTLSIDRGELRDAGFLALTPFAQVPVLELDDGRTLAESMAILRYLAEGTAWWPKEPYAQAQVMSWLSFEQARHMEPLAQLRLRIALHRSHAPHEAGMLAHRAHALAALQVLETRLARTGGWVATDGHPSIADVALHPYTRLAPMGGIELEPFPAIQAWLARLEALPGYQPLFPGEPHRNFSTSETQETP